MPHVPLYRHHLDVTLAITMPPYCYFEERENGSKALCFALIFLYKILKVSSKFLTLHHSSLAATLPRHFHPRIPPMHPFNTFRGTHPVEASTGMSYNGIHYRPIVLLLVAVIISDLVPGSFHMCTSTNLRGRSSQDDVIPSIPFAHSFVLSHDKLCRDCM